VLRNSCCDVQLEGGTEVRPGVRLKPLEWGKCSTAGNGAVKRPSAGSFLVDLIVHLMFQLRR